MRLLGALGGCAGLPAPLLLAEFVTRQKDPQRGTIGLGWVS